MVFQCNVTSALKFKGSDPSASPNKAACFEPANCRLPTPVSTPTKERSAKSVADVASPRTLSRAGRNNSPRIDYRTGKKVEDASSGAESGAKEDKRKKAQKTPSDSKLSNQKTARKRNKEKTPDSARSSTTSSPKPKRDASKKLAATDSSDDVVENTPPVQTSRSRRFVLKLP